MFWENMVVGLLVGTCMAFLWLIYAVTIWPFVLLYKLILLTGGHTKSCRNRATVSTTVWVREPW